MKLKMLLLFGVILFISISSINAADNSTLDDNNILSDSDGTFTDLSELINGDETVINLDKNYKYVSGDSVSSDGITINKAITINGNGCTIDASGSVRIFQITSPNVVLNNITFINGFHENGGAINVNSENVIVNNSYFKSNNASDSTSAGAIYWNSAKGIIENSIFESNKAYNAGAVLWLGKDGIIKNSSFINNYAPVAGALYIYSNLLIENSNFRYNKANGGGSMYIAGDNATIRNSRFEFESSAGYGGSIWFYRPNVKIENSTFKSCKANRYGGAIYANYENATIINCNFENNSANFGGSVYVINDYLSVENCNFKSDSANYHGGSIFFNAKNCKINNSNFTNCFASAGGGVYLVYKDEDTSVISNNYLSNSRFINNSARYGGAAVSVTDNAIINNSIFINNSAGNYGGAIDLTNSKLINSLLENNSAIFGGGIYIYNSDIINSTFINNQATSGNDIYILNISNLENNTFSDENIVISQNEIKGEVITSNHNIRSLLTTDLGYYAFCVEKYNFDPYTGVIDHSMEKLKNAINHEYIGDYLKILIYNFVDHFEDLRTTGFHNHVWAFSDGEYWNSDDPIVQYVIKLYNSGFRVPSQNACKILQNGTIMYLNFTSMVTPSGQQNLFLFKFDHGNVINETLDKEVLNKTAIVGDNIEYRIIISNKGNNTIYDNFIEDKDYSNGLVYQSWRAEVGNWSYDELTGHWKLPMLEAGKSASIILIFKVLVNGTLYNNATAGVGHINVTNSSDSVKVYNMNYTIEKHSLTPKIELGEQAIFEIIVKNRGNNDLSNVFVVESKYDSGLVYLDYVSVKGNWIHSLNNEGKHKFTLMGNISIDDSASFRVIFKTTKIGNLTNTVTSFNNTNATNSTEVYNKTTDDNSTKIINKTIPNNNTNITKKYINKSDDDLDKAYVKFDETTGNPFIVLILALIIIPFRRFEN